MTDRTGPVLARECQAQSLGERSSRSLPGNASNRKRTLRHRGHASALLTSLAPSPRPKLSLRSREFRWEGVSLRDSRTLSIPSDRLSYSDPVGRVASGISPKQSDLDQQYHHHQHHGYRHTRRLVSITNHYQEYGKAPPELGPESVLCRATSTTLPILVPGTLP